MRNRSQIIKMVFYLSVSQALLQIVLIMCISGEENIREVNDPSMVELLKLDDMALAGVRPVRLVRHDNSRSRKQNIEEVQEQGNTEQPWVAFKTIEGSPLPGIERGVRQANTSKPQTGDEDVEHLNNEDVVTIKIAGIPIVIPDFEITAKPQIKSAEKVQIETMESIIAEPKIDKGIQEKAAQKTADLQFFSTSSEGFRNLQNVNFSSNRFPKSHQTWRSSGPNHIFEIFVPVQMPNSNSREKQRQPIINIVKEVENPGKRTNFELQTMFKFVVDQSKTQNKKPSKPQKPKSSTNPDLVTKEEEIKPCPSSSLANCVDDCISHEDIYAYSGCVVLCSESCG